MPPAHPMQTSFNAGEWSPRMDGQVDHDKYRYACRKMENFVCLPQGPAKSRPGFEYAASTKLGTVASRLIPFVFSNTQSYVLEFGRYYIRFYMNRGQIVSGGVPYEVATPYAAEDVAGLQWAQSADVMYLFHPDYPVHKLSRSGHTSWTLTPVDWEDGPYLSQNSDMGIHLKSSAVSGAGATITAQYRYASDTFGTWDGTPAAAVPALTTALHVAGWMFTAPTDGLLQSVKVNCVSGAAAPDLVTAYLYSNNAGSPGTLRGTCTAAVDFDAAGEKIFTFSSEALTSGHVYWIVLEIATPDDAVTLGAVAHDAAYGSGTHATTITSITDNLGAAGEFQAEITYQPTGAASVFEAGHVGSIWRMRHSGQSLSHGFGSVSSSAAIQIHGEFTVDITVNASWEGRVILESSANDIDWVKCASFGTSTKQEFFEPETMYYRFRCTETSGGFARAEAYQIEQWGVFEVTGYGSASHVTATIISPLASVAATPYWCEGAWSDVRGYPRTGCFRDERLWLAGTKYQPQTLWGSWVGDYECMAPFDRDDAAVQFDLVEFCNPILWIVSHSSFLVGSSGEEARLATRKTEPISPSNPLVTEIQTTHGTQINTRPLKVGPAVLFIQQGGHKVREAAYALESNGYVAADLSILADHVASEGIIDFAYQQEPYSIVWCALSDGQLVGMTYYPAEKVIGWHRHPCQGNIESVCVIPAYIGDTEETRTELWVIRQLVIRGSTVRYVEYMKSHENLDDIKAYFCVDSGLTYYSTTTPVSRVTGLDHLAQRTVAICADGAPMAERKVTHDASDGTWGVDLDSEASWVHVGLPYTCELIPMRMEAGAADGTAQGRVKEIERVKVRILNTVGGKIGSCADDLVDISPYIEGSYLADTAPELQSGDTTVDGWPGNADTDGTIIIRQDKPVPMTVVAIMPAVTTND